MDLGFPDLSGHFEMQNISEIENLVKLISKLSALEKIIFILDHNINGRENITILNIPASLENSSPKTDTNT